MREGERVGAYELVRRLGGGGMGEVWEARDESLGRAVALKYIHEDHTGQLIGRFRHEARTLARLEHPGIVPVYQFLEDGGRSYLVMGIVHGRSLEEIVRRSGPRPAAQVIGWFVQAAEALRYAHDQNVTHRDLKPSNLMIDQAGDVRLIDFGLAISPGGSARFTRTGEIVGTPAYMAPEQFHGASELDSRTDIYSLALTMYWALTNARSVRQADGAHDYEPLPGFPQGLNRVMRKCLSPSPSGRYQDTALLVEDLRRILAPTSSSPTVVLAPIPGPVPRRRRPPMLAVATLALAILAAVGFLGIRWWRGMDNLIAVPEGEFIAGMDAVDIPSGLTSFPGWERLTQGGRHRVFLPAFSIDAHEVTNANYLRFVQATGWPAPPHWTSALPPLGQEGHPVVNVTYLDAEAYARWARKRLPTADEWEKAARGPNGQVYPWGNQMIEQITNTLEAGRGGTCAVTEFPGDRSPLGVLGMGGNATEWTSTREGSTGEGRRVLCGGSYLESGTIVSLSSFRRFADSDTMRYPDVSFRCVR